jgi:hydrogenase maturation protease
VIGLGNPLMGDDGVGLAALARLAEEFTLPPGVELVDGGTWGMNLLPLIEDAGRVLLIDAIHKDGAPGTPYRLSREDLPRYLTTKISPHQVDLHDVLALAELRGTMPDDTVAVGLQPERVEMIAELSPAVAAGVGQLVAMAVAELTAWGFVLTPRPPLPAGEGESASAQQAAATHA